MFRPRNRPRVLVLRALAVVIASAMLAACGGGDEAGQRTALGSEAGGVDDLSPELQIHLDAGNYQYRAREYEEAIQHYSEVVRLDPQLAAGWYGLGMAHQALGNTAAADSAMAEVHRLAPELPLEHPTTEAPPNPHPIQPTSIPGGY
jgi:tetratricopeptide (TPR) repeat protein